MAIQGNLILGALASHATSSNTAVVSANELLTYTQFNQRVQTIAFHLSALGVGKGDHVIAILDRNIDLMPTIFALWYLGAVYVPVDPAAPLQHQLKVIELSGAKHLVCSTPHSEEWASEYTVLCVSDITPSPTYQHIVPVSLSPDDLAYIIFSSGSTGEPKGILIEHGALFEFCGSVSAQLQLSPNHCFLALSLITFDFSIYELIVPLFLGAKLVVATSKERLKSQAIIQLIEEHQVDFLPATPSQLYTLIDGFKSLTKAPKIIAGGEAIAKSLVHELLKYVPSVYNCYGPTECTVFSLVAEVTDSYREGDGWVDIGESLSCCQHLILNDLLVESSNGEGELAIYGRTLGRGYLANPALTAEKFVTIEHPTLGELRVYRTGDRVKRTGSDRYQYLGRLDRQIKRNGNRIELGYLESHILTLSAVDRCAVVFDAAANVLACYYTGQEASSEALFRLCQSLLPVYMIPQHFIYVAALPFTERGKIDTKRLELRLKDDVKILSEQAVSTQEPFCATAAQQLTLSVFPNRIVNLESSFLSQGLTSLDALSLVNQMADKLSLSGDVYELLQCDSINTWLAQLVEIKKESHFSASSRCTTEQFYTPLISQTALYHLHSLYGNSSAYHLTRGFLIDGLFDIEQVEAKWLELLAQCRNLNVIFESEPQLHLAVKKDFAALVRKKALTEDSAEVLCQQIHLEKMDLERELPYRLYSITLADKHLFVLKIHHYAIDGWSLDALIEGFNSVLSGRALSFSPDALAKPSNEMAGAKIDREFWLDYLHGAPQVHNLVLCHARPAICNFNGSLLEFAINASLSERIKSFCQQHKLSEFNFYSTVYALTISKFSLVSDVVIGSPFANRRSLQDEMCMGYLAQFLPLRYQFNDTDTVLASIKQAAVLQQLVFANKSAHFEQIIDLIKPQRHLSMNPLTQLSFALQPNEEALIQISGCTTKRVNFDPSTAKFDLACELVPSQNEARLRFEYNTDLFSREFVEQLAASFVAVCEQLDHFSKNTVTEVYLPAPEMPAAPSKQTATSHTTILHHLLQIVSKHGDRIAVSDGNAQYSYDQLWAHSGRIALYLQQQGVMHGDRVALSVPKDAKLAIFLLAILRVGGCYVPIDPNYPAQRKTYLFNDCGAKCLIADAQFSDELNTIVSADLLSLDMAQSDIDFISEALSGHSCAYMIYTSGSTGKPKGVEVSHHNLLRLMTTSKPLFSFSELDTWCLFHSYSFDFSVWEMWGAWFYGGKLMVPNAAITTQPPLFADYLVKHNITVLNQTPSAFYMLSEQMIPAQHHLRYVIFGGEMLVTSKLARWFASYQQQTALINMYGITETTVHVTFRHVLPDDINAHRSPIGLCLPDLQTWVLDAQKRPVPWGCPGELYVAGDGVAIGYFERPELNAERFIDVSRFPFADSTTQTQRVYRSGDLVRYTPDGSELEYLGRIDNQVKIRGYRIEIGEVEQAFRQLPDVRDATVWVEQEGNEKFLSAFVVTSQFDERFIREELVKSLPTFMVPRMILPADSLLVNHHGKVDHQQMLAKFHQNSELSDSNTELAPRAMMLVELVKSVLKRTDVGLRDSFFGLGGDSILSLQLVSRAKEAGLNFTLADLYRCSDFDELLSCCSEGGEQAITNNGIDKQLPAALWNEVICSVSHPVSDAYPLSALQLAMIGHADADVSGATYHDIFDYELSLNFDLERFVQALQFVIDRQYVLRTQFVETTQGYVQTVLDHVSCDVEYIDCTAMNKNEIEFEITNWKKRRKVQGFNFATDLLYKIALFHVGANQIHFLISFHHAVFDGWSVAHLLKDLISKYKNLDFDTPLQPNYFKQTIYQELDNLSDHDFITHWKTQTQNAYTDVFGQQIAQVPDAQRKQKVTLDLNSEDCHALNMLCRSHQLTVQHGLLAIHQTVMNQLLGSDSFATCVVNTTRPAEQGAELVAGLFVNSLPLVCRTTAKDISQAQLLELAKNIRKQLSHRTYVNYPLSEIQRHSGKRFADVMFNYTHFHIYDGVFDEHVSLLSFRYDEETNFKFYVHVGQEVASHRLTLNLVRDCRYVPQALAEAYQRNFVTLLQHFVGDNNAFMALSTTSDFTPPEHQFSTFNLFLQAKCREHANQLALLDDQHRLTYSQLAGIIEQVSEWLSAEGVKQGDRVAIQIPRSNTLPLLTLAVLNIGAVFVAVPADYPPNRQDAIIKEALPCCVIDESHRIYHLLQEVMHHAPQGSLTPRPHNVQQAALLFTSGSTGKPKGVCISAAMLMSLVEGQVAISPLLAVDSVTLQFASCGFDVYLQELLTTLDTGGKLVSINELQKQDINQLIAVLVNQKVTRLYLPNAVLQLLCDEINRQEISLPHLACVISAGERLILSDTLKAFFRRHPQLRLCNHYGPTETHVVTAFMLPVDISSWPSEAPIGRALPHANLKVCGPLGEEVVPGLAGELWVAGDCVSLGYFNDDVLTLQKFVQKDSYRWYRTGDWVRREGEYFHFIGRQDDQIKVNGVRIELQEIENLVNELLPENHVYLVASKRQDVTRLYGVIQGHSRIDIRTINDKLAAFLATPASLAGWIQVDAFPTTQNGKLDRHALSILAEKHGPKRGSIKPQTEQQHWLLAQCKGLLKLDHLSLEDNFFAQGGHSLLLTQLIARIHHKFQVKIAMGEVMNAIDIAQIDVMISRLLEEEETYTEEFVL